MRGPGSLALAMVLGLTVTAAPGSAQAQLPGHQVSASTCAAAIGGDVTDSAITIVCGMPHKDVVDMVRLAASSDAEDRRHLHLRLDALIPETSRLRVGALETFFETLGESQVDTANLQAKLVEIAEQHLELLDRLRTVLSEDPAVQRLKDQAATAIEDGDYDQAETLLEKAEETDLAATREAREVAQRQQQVADQRFLSAAASRAERGAIKALRFDYVAAAEDYLTAADLIPPGHPLEQATYLNKAGEAHFRAGLYDRAVLSLEEALRLRKQALSPDDADVAVSLNNLAELYRTQGRYAEAEPLHQRALAIREAALGPDHPHVAKVLFSLALVHEGQGRSLDAVSLLERVLAIFEDRLGSDHHYTRSAQEKLVVVRAAAE